MSQRIRQNWLSRMLWIGFALLLMAVSSRAATNTWLPAGPSTNDWSVATNWSGGVPAAGDDAVITNASVVILLTNSAPASEWLSSLTISNTATLIFSNWNTTLSATNVTIATNAMVTCAGPFTNTVMSNRVWLVCSNLSVAVGASINVDGKGYAGAATNETRGHGPGNGTLRAGGTYGGFGGQIGGTNGTDTPYGSPDTSLWPGSGGGAYGSAPYRGGAGGGAVYIQAGGTVTVNGTITADGQAGPTAFSAGGSGGGIAVTCQVLAGTNGAIRANGGNGNGYCGGGGGRIAVSYDVVAQGLTPLPSIRFSTDRGLGCANDGIMAALEG
ncbi:MAG: hypothetical protein HYV36_06005 [Lentisphaerae bacterium]|nr:hypothetical protein [Lentisphaerota bacterium]